MFYYNMFLEKGLCNVNPIHDIFRWMFVYYRCYMSKEFTVLKELMLIKQVDQKSAIFVTIVIS